MGIERVGMKTDTRAAYNGHNIVFSSIRIATNFVLNLFFTAISHFFKENLNN